METDVHKQLQETETPLEVHSLKPRILMEINRFQLVGSFLLSLRSRRTLACRGVWGHAPAENFEN